MEFFISVFSFNLNRGQGRFLFKNHLLQRSGSLINAQPDQYSWGGGESAWKLCQSSCDKFWQINDEIQWGAWQDCSQ